MLSPNGKVSASLVQDPDLRYAVEFHGTRVIEPSALGITIDGVQHTVIGIMPEKMARLFAMNYPLNSLKPRIPVVA